MTEFKKLLLARLHESAQIYTDRVIWFVLTGKGLALSSQEKDELHENIFGVSATLGRHTMAIFGVNELDLEKHINELFKRLELLEVQCRKIGAPTMGGGFAEYRRKLQEA